MAKAKRGFTLVELMVGLFIGSLTVIVAAHVAQMLVQQSAQGRQTTDFNQRTRVLGKQLRADIRSAGIGSTGAVTADPGVQPWGTILTVTSNFGYPAMPVVSGANSAAGAPGGSAVLANSDAIMLVVPNPARGGFTTNVSPAGSNVLPLNPATGNLAGFAGCQFVYIVDHSTPSGSGRAQIATFAGVAGTNVQIGPDTLQFSVQPGADVMCARVSTYWVSDDDGDGLGNWLHRSDLQPGNVPVDIGGGGSSRVWVDPASVGNVDLIAPGILDLQIAYAFSAALWTNNGAAPPAAGAVADRWAYATPAGGPAEGQIIAAADPSPWFEARMVRLNLMAKKMRTVSNMQTVSPEPRAEDQSGATLPVLREFRIEQVVTTEAVTNLRYFDMGMPRGVRAEPM